MNGGRRFVRVINVITTHINYEFVLQYRVKEVRCTIINKWCIV